MAELEEVISVIHSTFLFCFLASCPCVPERKRKQTDSKTLLAIFLFVYLIYCFTFIING